MKRSLRTSKVLPAMLAAVALLGICNMATGGDYKDKDFSLRFPAAMTRFAMYGDVAGVGGASAGSKWASSINPAAIAWLDLEGPLQTCVSGQYSKVWFDNGTEFDVFTESVTIDADWWGTYLVGAAQAKSNQRDMRNGYDFDFSTDIFQVQWAKKLTETWALGFTFNYSKAIVRNNLGSIPIAKSNSDSYLIRLGTLHGITEKLLAGLVLDYGWSRDRTNYYAIPAFNMPEEHVYDNTRQFLARPGISFEYMKDSTVYLDYEFGTFWNDTGTLNVHRIRTGVEHALLEWVYPRAGVTLDPAVGSCSWTCGVGFYPAEWLSIDVAYQFDMLPEIAEEFGRSHTFNISVSLTF